MSESLNYNCVIHQKQLLLTKLDLSKTQVTLATQNNLDAATKR